MLSLIQATFFGKEINEEITEETFIEMKKHAIETLPASILSSLKISAHLLGEWKQSILQVLTNNIQYRYFLSNLPITVPYAILKGVAAAQYYPTPDYRILGDIDIITHKNDYEKACNMLLENGFYENSSIHNEATDRHRSFEKNGFTIEVHAYFSIFNDVEKSVFLDNLIINNISSTHILPDMINGLVLLAHIDQHFEQGIGLRQIIDWMMFVNQCLSDDKWDEFAVLAKKVGLDKLAIVTTRMCELYMGLPERKWAASADISLCRRLMDYILDCGNFGNKKPLEYIVGQNVFSYISKPKAIIKLMQERGMKHWKGAQRLPFLRPFAWLYQGNRYIVKGLSRSNATTKLKDEYKASKKRKALCNALGATQASKGIVVYQNGEFRKK